MSAPELIIVTPELVARGIPCSGGNCPIALAIKAQWGGPIEDIEVTQENIYVWLSDETYAADTPVDAACFIHDFDNLEAPAPITFALTWRSDRAEATP